jgi:diguanylate cyclase (GGDEF)-like protein
VLLLVAQLAGESVRLPSRRSPVVWLLAFGVVEAGLAAAVLLPSAGETWPWFAALAAAAVAAGAIPGPWVAAGLTAAGLVALAAARLGTLDVVPGLAALAAGGLAYGLHGTPFAAEEAGQAGLDPAAEDRGTEEERLTLAAEEESMRLARELRGTIEELLHARRTIEMQREEIARAATVDALTGVATRRAILDRLAIDAAGARRYQHPFALVLLDLDGFARLNHERGIEIGDAVLREVALRLRLRVRAADALGRVGSDSFLAILPHTDETGAATFAGALLRLLTGRPIDTEAGELVIAVSIGVAFMRPGMSLTDEELLASADEALASARAAGGNRIAFDRAHGLIRLEERRVDREGA